MNLYRHKNKITALSLYIFFFILPLFLVKILKLDSLGNLIEIHWHILDIEVLKQYPLNSLLHLHAQPPLLNFIVWILTNFEGNLYNNFIIINLLCNGITSMVIYSVSKFYFQSSIYAFLLAVLYTISPGVILNTAYPFYPCLTAAGISLLVYSFFISDTRKTLSVTLLLTSLTYLSFLRSYFTVVHVILIMGIYYFYIQKKPNIKTFSIYLLIEIILVITVPVKNYMLYDFFGTSSWAPINLAKGFGIEMNPHNFPTPEEIQRLPLDPNNYGKHYGIQDTQLKKHNGYPNYNSYLTLGYASSQKNIIFSKYNIYKHIRRIAGHIHCYFKAPDKYFVLTNRENITLYANVFDSLIFLTKDVRFGIFFILLISFFISLDDRYRFIRVLISIFLIHFLTHILTDGDEGERFVIDIEFIFFILFSILFHRKAILKTAI